MESKKKNIISIIALLALGILLIASTYAYLQGQTGEGSQTDVKITANTVDTLTFETGSDLTFKATQDNFAPGKESIVGSIIAKAMLSANNKTNTAADSYYVYLNIIENNFIYTQDSNTPELLLQVTNSDDEEVTNLSGLTYKTVTDGQNKTISGFDVTNKNGLFSIATDKEITTTSFKEEVWSLSLVFVNYDANQSENAEKNFKANVIIQKNKIIDSVDEVCTNGDNLNNCIISLYNNAGSIGTRLYHHDANLENGANDNSYRFSGSNPNNFVCFGTNSTPCPSDNLYRIIGVFGDNYHGVSGQQLVKLIKYDYATKEQLGTDGTYNISLSLEDFGYENGYKGNLTKFDVYYWNYNTSGIMTNTWSTSLLNNKKLNKNYINNIGTTWANKIATTIWKVGGNTGENIAGAIPTVAYQNEIVSPDVKNSTDNATEYQAKIGLMYVSDYGFAISPNFWDKKLNEHSNISVLTSSNWLFMSADEWVITREVGFNSRVFLISRIGVIAEDGLIDFVEVLRPTFLLTTSTTYVSGSGTINDPIILS